MFATTHKLLADGIFGQITTPPGVSQFGSGTHGEGLIIFISNMIKVFAVIAGLIALFNVISAGYTFLSSDGNPKATEEAMSKLFYSLIGLILIVGAFTITAIISLLLFGNPMFILSPSIPTPAAG